MRSWVAIFMTNLFAKLQHQDGVDQPVQIHLNTNDSLQNNGSKLWQQIIRIL